MCTDVAEKNQTHSTMIGWEAITENANMLGGNVRTRWSSKGSSASAHAGDAFERFLVG